MPDFHTENSWATDLYIRNNGTEQRQVWISLFSANGSLINSYSCGLNPNQRCWLPLNSLLPSNSSGSAFVDGGENASVVVARYRPSPYVSAAYTGLTSPATTIYVPLVQRNNSGWYNDLVIMNASASATTPTVHFQRRDLSGDACPQTLSSVPPNGSVTLRTNAFACPAGQDFTIGSARVTASQPLALLGVQWKDYTGDGWADALMDDEGLPAAALTTYYPLLQRGNGGTDSGLALQNPGSANTVTLNYYSQAGGGCGQSNLSLPQTSMTIIFPLPVTCPLPYIGSGKATGTQPWLSLVNHNHSTDRDVMSHSAVGGGTQAAAVPLVFRNATALGRSGWYSGLSLQNTSAATASITLHLYDSGGASVYASSWSVAPYATKIVYPLPVAEGFVGSAWVSADRTIAVSATHVVSPASGGDDAWMAYLGVNR